MGAPGYGLRRARAQQSCPDKWVPKWSLGTRNPFLCCARRQRSCGDKGVPKCNLGTRKQMRAHSGSDKAAVPRSRLALATTLGPSCRQARELTHFCSSVWASGTNCSTRVTAEGGLTAWHSEAGGRESRPASSLRRRPRFFRKKTEMPIPAKPPSASSRHGAWERETGEIFIREGSARPA